MPHKSFLTTFSLIKGSQNHEKKPASEEGEQNLYLSWERDLLFSQPKENTMLA